MVEIVRGGISKSNNKSHNGQDLVSLLPNPSSVTKFCHGRCCSCILLQGVHEMNALW
jgi:hypothetical protein